MFNGKTHYSISMAIFNSYMLNYQRVVNKPRETNGHHKQMEIMIKARPGNNTDEVRSNVLLDVVHRNLASNEVQYTTSRRLKKTLG